MSRLLRVLVGSVVAAGIASGTVAAAVASTGHSGGATRLSVTAPLPASSAPDPVVKYHPAAHPVRATAPVVHAAAAPTTTTTVWTGPTYNGSPCTSCVSAPSEGITPGPTGLGPTGQPLPDDPAVWVWWPTGLYCGQVSQTTAIADGLTIIPASSCVDYVYQGVPNPPPNPAGDNVPCCTVDHMPPPSTPYTCWNGQTIDLSTGATCPLYPHPVGAIKPDGTCVTTTYENATDNGWQVLVDGCPDTTTTTSSPPSTAPAPTTTTVPETETTPTTAPETTSTTAP